MIPARSRVRALCCACGRLRTTSRIGQLVADPMPHEDQTAGRCLLRRKCTTCRAETLHAYLRDAPEEAWCRDIAERDQREREELIRRQDC